MTGVKERYPEGILVRFVRFGEPDPYTKLKPGTLGVVSLVDDLGTVHVDWSDGSTLGMLVDGSVMDEGAEPDVIEIADEAYERR